MREQRGPLEKTQCKLDKVPANRETRKKRVALARPTTERAPTK